MRLAVFFQFTPDEKIPVGTLSEIGRDMVFEYDAAPTRVGALVDAALGQLGSVGRRRLSLTFRRGS